MDLNTRLPPTAREFTLGRKFYSNEWNPDDCAQDITLGLKTTPHQPWGWSSEERSGVSEISGGVTYSNAATTTAAAKGTKRKRPQVDLRGLVYGSNASDLGIGLTCMSSSTILDGGRSSSSSRGRYPMDLGLVLAGSIPHSISTVSSASAISSLDDGAAAAAQGGFDGPRMSLQLGVKRTSEGSSNRSHRSNVGMHLQLGLSGGDSTGPCKQLFEEPGTAECRSLLDNIPVVDEGSTSARRAGKHGGYMPTLLMGLRFNPPTQLQPDDQSTFVMAGRNSALQGAVEMQTPMQTQTQTQTQTTTTTTNTSKGNGGSSRSERATKMCQFNGCSKGARGASGLCIAHGGGRRCQKDGCSKGAEGRTVYCKAHGGGRRCQNLGCTKSAEGKTEYCIAHGGGRRCSQEGCTKAARGRSGLCIRHGGGKRCQREGCTKSAEGHSGLCIAHGGGRRCQYQGGCTKGAQGSTNLCKAHGGGKRCIIQGCSKGAEGSTPLCKGHGGGKRCLFQGGGICTKSVHGGTDYCVAHGGGKRCAVSGCTKSARGRTAYCVRHGGGKRCKSHGCGKSAQGSTDFCKAHGGGTRCSWGRDGSPYSQAFIKEKTTSTAPILPCDKFARGKTGLCAAHNTLIQDRRVHGGNALAPGIQPGLFRGLVPIQSDSNNTVKTNSTPRSSSINDTVVSDFMDESGCSQLPLISSDVLVPPSMQMLTLASPSSHVGLNCSLSMHNDQGSNPQRSEGRVHGGNFMAFLSSSRGGGGGGVGNFLN